jgi:hypothetical protein
MHVDINSGVDDYIYAAQELFDTSHGFRYFNFFNLYSFSVPLHQHLLSTYSPTNNRYYRYSLSDYFNFISNSSPQRCFPSFLSLILSIDKHMIVFIEAIPSLFIQRIPDEIFSKCTVLVVLKSFFFKYLLFYLYKPQKLLLNIPIL